METICCKDVLFEIFSWLPPDSLIRFKCVSKSWYGLINFLTRNPEFVNKHLRNMKNKILFSSPCLVFCCPGPGYWRHPELEFLRHKLFKSVTVFHDGDNLNYVTEVFFIPTLPSEVNLAHALRSHCNGIICLAHCETIILCNPAIREWRRLPKPCLVYGGFILLGVGFGYDSRANDYKVVRFGYDEFLHDGVEYFKTRAEVYSMRSDSWREIGIRLEFDRFPLLGKHVFCKGFFYWFIRTHNIVISFNVFDEVFHSVPLPDNLLVAWKDHSIQLAVWNESVALFLYTQEKAVTNSIEVWVTDDSSGGVNGSCSWIKKLVIGPLVGIAFPLAFLKNDEVLMKAIGRRLVLYNLRSQMQRNLTLVQAGSAELNWDFSYVKSLVSVQAGS